MKIGPLHPAGERVRVKRGVFSWQKYNGLMRIFPGFG
jgi:hypothetical protein